MPGIKTIVFRAVQVVESVFEGGVKSVASVVKSLRALVDPDYRHFLAYEHANDATQRAINQSHRFQSFAKQRQKCTVKWHISGLDYFWAVSEMLDAAEECIFILDWWLSPELYLRRPPALHEEWRLDRLLERKAEQGVKIFIVVYNEVRGAASQDSEHTQHALEGRHSNIHVMRHPQHFDLNLGQHTWFWSHHEKVVVVDNNKACIGGLDLCFGRWDTQTHPLVDVHPTEFVKTLFPGQDYNNARYEDFHSVENYLVNGFSILEQVRMPWEDIHMTLIGPAVLDITQHFIERWNFVKVQKYRHNPKYEYLAFPHDISTTSSEVVKHHRHLAFWQMKGIHWVQRWLEEYTPPENTPDSSPNGTCQVQVVRSSSGWSHGIETEHSIQNAYIQLIKESKHFIYIENQFFISNTCDQGPIKNRIAEALVERILRAASEGKKFRVVVCIPEVPGFAGSVKSSSISNILAAQFRTINRGGHSIYELIAKAGYNPLEYIRFYHLRNYDRINGPSSLIDAMEKKSGVSFDQAQVALARQWLGHAKDSDVPRTIVVKSPRARQWGMMLAPNMGKADGEEQDTEKRIPVPKTYEEAKAIVERFESAAPRSDDLVADTVSQHVQLDETTLQHEQWLGTPQEERNAYVSEEIYIHTKVMIIDDMQVIMGSANLNDRSMCGNRDSEIALIVEDTHLIPSRMDGAEYPAAAFAATLRRKLFRKHLGLIHPQMSTSKDDPVTGFMLPSPLPLPDESTAMGAELVMDPLDDALFDRWNDQARSNTAVYARLFRTVPSNAVKSWDGMKAYLPVVKQGHLADPSTPLDNVEERLSTVRGHLVEAQLGFLSEEKNWTSDDTILWSGADPAVEVYT